MARRRRHSAGEAPVTRAEFEALEQQVRRAIQKGTMGLGVQSVLGGGGGGDDGYEWWFDGRTSFADAADTAAEADHAATADTATSADSAVPVSDGGTPTAPPNLILDPGPGWLQARWLLPSGTVDPLFYHVFIDTTPDFTANFGTNWVGTTFALSYVINLDGAGNQLQTGTTYYVKAYAVSSYSGNAGELSEEASGTPDVLDASVTTLANIDAGTITVGELDAARISAGSIDASKFSSVLALVSSLFAGTEGAQRVEVGYGTNADGTVDTSWIGIRAYDVDGETITFSVDADTGEVFIGGTLGNTVLAGAMTFGAGSVINSNDSLTIQEQPPGSFQDPDIVQSVSNFKQAPSPNRVSCTWDAPTTDGNLLLMAVAVYGAPSAPALSTPSGWTRVGAIQQFFGGSNFRMALYYIEGATSRSGTQIVNVSSGVLDAFDVVMMEVSGAEFFDQVAADDGSGTAVDTGASPATTQADEFVLAILGHSIDPDGTPGAPGPAGWTLAETVSDESDGASAFARLSVYHKNVSATGAQQFTATLDESKLWSAKVATFKAKATAVPAAPADKLKLYAKDASDAARLYAMDENGVEHDLFLPPGTVLPYAGASAPDGFLLADGSAVSRTIYAALFDAVGTTFGSGDGSTTFNLPDLTGRVPVGKHASWAEFDALGEAGGSRTHDLTVAEMPAHTHQISTSAGGDLRAGANNPADNNGPGPRSGGTDSRYTAESNGGGGSHNNLQPYVTLNYIVKV